jgi:hypothetical protein
MKPGYRGTPSGDLAHVVWLGSNGITKDAGCDPLDPVVLSELLAQSVALNHAKCSILEKVTGDPIHVGLENCGVLDGFPEIDRLRRFDHSRNGNQDGSTDSSSFGALRIGEPNCSRAPEGRH